MDAPATKSRYGRRKRRVKKVVLEQAPPPQQQQPHLVVATAAQPSTTTPAPLAKQPSVKDAALMAMCDAWLTPNVELVAWDFDNTLLTIHAYKEKVKPNEVAGRWQRDVCDIDLVRAFVHVARQRGIQLGIASFGKQEVILTYMEAMLAGTGNERAFTTDNVATPSWVGKRDGQTVRNGKPKLLRLLRERNGANPDGPKGGVLFFDDQKANIESCRTAGYPRAVHTPEGFAQHTLGDPRTQQAALKAPVSLSALSKLGAMLRRPVAVVTDAVQARRRRVRRRRVAKKEVMVGDGWV